MTYPSFLATPDTRWGQRQIIKFGGLPRPDTGIVQAFIDLNDTDAWFAQSIQVDGRHISNKSSQLNWRGKAVWTAQDFIGRKITIPAMYDDGNSGGISYPQAKGILTMAGEQYLTFDNLTGIRVRLNSFSQAEPKTPDPPYLWDAPLEFLSRNPFAEDLGGATSQTASISGGLANMTVNYGGAAYGEPVLVFTGSCSVNGTIDFTNVTSGQAVSISVGAFSGSHVITFDSTLFTAVVDVTPFAPTGTFPFLFPGTNVLQLTGSGTLSGNWTVSWASKYEL